MLRFDKYQGLGNDFVVVGAEAIPAGIGLAEFARRICDRHFGVGADGALIVAPSEVADARMIVINQDGSRPQMCGNGVRCFALHLARTQGPRPSFAIETDAGVRRCAMGVRGSHAVVEVDMGPVVFDPAASGVDPGASAKGSSVEGAAVEVLIRGERIALRTASLGNPHAVCLVRDPQADLHALARTFGAEISRHPTFREGVNVEWARAGEEGLEVVVYERGAGLTLACGTGACAVAAVARRLGAARGDEIAVNLPGGRLWVRFDPTLDAPGRTGPVTLTGPAAFVFSGELEALPDLGASA